MKARDLAEMFSTNPTYRVYSTLAQLIECRHLVLVSGDMNHISSIDLEKGKLLEADDFISTVQRYGYIIVEAEDAPGKDRRYPSGVIEAAMKFPVKTLLVLLDQDSIFMSGSQQFTKMLNSISEITSDERAHSMDIIVIPYDMPKSNITRKMIKYNRPGSETCGFTRLTMCPHYYFSSNKFKNVIMSPARILSREEEKKAMTEMYCSKNDIARAKMDDIMCVWLGAEVHDMLEVNTPSETSGVTRTYIYVRP